MHIYLFVVICAANLVFRAGNLCSAREINLYASSSSDGWLGSTDNWWDSSYTWIITAPYGQKVLLNFDRLRLSNSSYCQNYLEVRNGQYSFSPLLTKQCYSFTPPSPVYSEGRYLYVKFSRNYNSDGISAKVRALNDLATDCPKVLKGNNTGVIYSPGFPFGYSDSVDCSWVISGKFYYSYLLLNFTVFDLESGCYEKVVVRDGRYSWSSRLGQYCSDNSQAPFVVTPSGSIARVEFTSDWGGLEKGFLMFYRMLDSYTPTRAPTTYPWYTKETTTTEKEITESEEPRIKTAPLGIIVGCVTVAILAGVALLAYYRHRRNGAEIQLRPAVAPHADTHMNEIPEPLYEEINDIATHRFKFRYVNLKIDGTLNLPSHLQDAFIDFEQLYENLRYERLEGIQPRRRSFSGAVDEHGCPVYDVLTHPFCFNPNQKAKVTKVCPAIHGKHQQNPSRRETSRRRSASVDLGQVRGFAEASFGNKAGTVNAGCDGTPNLPPHLQDTMPNH